MAVTQPENIPSSTENFRIHVFSPSDLLKPVQRQLLINVNNLVNDVYSTHGHPKRNGELPPNYMYEGMRIEAEDQLAHELGVQGLLAICIDERLDAEPSQELKAQEKFNGTQPGMYGKLVAVASLKPWKGNLVKFYLRMQELKDQVNGPSLNDLQLAQLAKKHATSNQQEGIQTWDWEVTICGSIDNPIYRKQGFIIRCLDALIETLKARRDTFKASGDARGSLPIKLWSTSLEGSGNTEYWLRRGFVREGEPDSAPQGLWTSTRPFVIQTLSRVVE